jgi:hypothetical protein
VVGVLPHRHCEDGCTERPRNEGGHHEGPRGAGLVQFHVGPRLGCSVARGPAIASRATSRDPPVKPPAAAESEPE